MPQYQYECECGNVFKELWFSFKDAEPFTGSHPCPAEACGNVAQRDYSCGPAAAIFKGHFPGKRIKEVDARKSRQEARLDEKVKKGEITKQDVVQMAKIRDKYAKASPYMTDVKKLKEGQSETEKRKREENQKPFHHELEM